MVSRRSRLDATRQHRAELTDINHRDEHYRREPDCRFFSLISSQPAPKKSARTKAARSSKASRLSIQSFANLADMSSMDATGEVDDSTLTTASKSTTASKASKKPGKTKKATNSIRAAKTRTQKDETVEIHEDEPEAEAGLPPAPLPQNTRGRKRASEEVEDSMDTNNEAPPPKKRITKTRKRRGSDATEASQADTEILDELEIVKKPAAKGKRKASGARKASGTRGRKPSGSTTGSHTTPASNASPPPQIPDDEEIDRQLQADLERPLTDEEDILADPVTEKGAAGRRSMEAVKPSIEVDNPFSQTAKADFAMFDPSPVEPSEAQIEADLQSMEDDMEVEQVEPEPQPATEADSKPAKSEIHVPKKGRTAGGVRKVSKQTALKKTKELAANIERAQARMTAEAEEPDEIAEADVSFGSAGTTLRKSLSRASLGSVNSNKGTGKRGRPRKVPQEPVDEPTTVPTAHEEPTVSAASDAMDMDDEPAQPVAEATKKRHSNGKRGRPRKNVEASDVADEAVPIEAPVEPQAAPEDTETEPEAPKAGKLPSRAGSPMKVARKPVPAPKDSPFAIRETPVTSVSKSAAQLLSMPPKTLRHQGSPAQSAKQATVSPSPSPQASDAENRPPSSKPNTHSSKRMALGDLPTATPMRQGSPSKTQHQQQQPVMGGLETREPWTAVDLDIIFQDYHGGRQNEQGAASRFFANGGELTSSERAMSVEEWIYYNAGQAEQQLKFECETMVMAFEREGTRALRVLEGLAIEEA